MATTFKEGRRRAKFPILAQGCIGNTIQCRACVFCNRNAHALMTLATSYWRANPVPGAAAIPAPNAFIKRDAVQRFVVGPFHGVVVGLLGPNPLRQPLVHKRMQFTLRNTSCSILRRCLNIGLRCQCALAPQRPAPHYKHMHTAITGGSRAPKGRDSGGRSKYSIASPRALTRGPYKRCLIFVIVVAPGNRLPGGTSCHDNKQHCWLFFLLWFGPKPQSPQILLGTGPLRSWCLQCLELNKLANTCVPKCHSKCLREDASLLSQRVHCPKHNKTS